MIKIEFKKLLEGIGNSIFVKEEVEKIAAERISVCESCPHYSPNAKVRGENIVRKDKFCYLCGCNMYLKTRSLAASCPEDKWLAVTNEEDAEKIENTELLKKEIDEYKINLMQDKVEE